MWQILLFSLLPTAFAFHSNCNADTKYGPVKGVVELTLKFPPTPYCAFKGIPFATPPLGPLRFMNPIPPTPWIEPKDSTQFGNRCCQTEFTQIGEEDCLTVNVFTPSVPVQNNSMLPVMVYMHGGGFTIGHTSLYGPKKLMDREVVSVTCNYRVGILGFMSTEDNSSTGNFGLKDQWFCLKWVQENILNFGGDPTKVTLIGESAGSSSVMYHLISSMSTGLFQLAIPMSGALAPWAYNSCPLKWAIDIGQKVNCPTNNSQALVQCLRTVDAKTLSQIVSELPLGDPFVPSLDGEFLTEDPLTSLQTGNIANKNVTVLSGWNKNETIPQDPTPAIFSGDFTEFPNNTVPYVVERIWKVLNGTCLNETTELLTDKYLYNFNQTCSIIPILPTELICRLNALVADAVIVVPHVNMLLYMLNAGMKVYMYKYLYVQNIAAFIVNTLIGIIHGQEVLNIYDFCYDYPILFMFCQANDKIQNRILDYFINFVYYGDPTPPNSNSPINWQLSQSDNITVALLDKVDTVNYDYFESDTHLAQLVPLYRDDIPQAIASECPDICNNTI